MTNTEIKLCVVLLNYRTPDLVLDCLESLLPQVRRLSSIILIVDNDSQDDSVEKIQSWIDANQASECAKLIASDVNGGFAAGNNIGIQSADAEHYLLINSDTLVRENALAHMLGVIDANPEVGLLSPRLEWQDGQAQESCFRFHRPLSELLRGANTGLILKLFRNSEVAKRVDSNDSDSEWTSFACVMIRKKVFDEVGLLDDKFFMYYEDAEFCHRAWKQGWVIRNHPAARVVHLRGGSSPVKANSAAKKRQARYYYESRTRYFYKLFGRAGLLAANLLWTLGWLLANVRALVQRSFYPTSCKSEWRDIWTNFLCPDRQYTHPKDYRK